MSKQTETELHPVEYKVIAVIDNFQCTVPRIDFTPHLSIRSIDTLTEEEQAVFSGPERMGRNIEFKPDGSIVRTRQLTFIQYQPAAGRSIERTREHSNHVFYWYFKDRLPLPVKKTHDVVLTAGRNFGSVLSALRMLQDVPVGMYPQEHFYIDVPGFTKAFSRTTHTPRDGYLPADPEQVDPYVLLQEEIDPLKQLFEVIHHTKESGVLTALSRLDKQYTRASIVDRLIDAVIALEALYAGKANTEITLRVGLRVSAHLGTDAKSREHYFNLFNLAYSLRSSLVHGSIYHGGDIEKEVQKKSWKNNETFMRALDDMLRQSLRLILTDPQIGKLKEDLYDPLDKAIRQGEMFKRP